MMVRSCQRCQRVSTLSALLPPSLGSRTTIGGGFAALTAADSADGNCALKPSPKVEVSAVSLARADTPRLFTPSSLYFPPSPFRWNPLTPLTPPPLAAPPQSRCERRHLRPAASPSLCSR
jgi:hypothetical protein